MSTRKKGLIEAISWKAIVSSIATFLAFFIAIPEYVYNLRPALRASIGSDAICFIEGAVTSAITVFIVLKLYSQLSSKKETTKTLGQTPDSRQLKKRIRQELTILRDQIRLDLENQNFQSRTYNMDAFQSLKHDLVLGLDNTVYGEVKETYDKINGLQYSSNLGGITIRKYQEAIRAIERSINLLR